MDSEKKPIKQGIIGGLGPLSTAVLYRKIIDISIDRGAEQDYDFPQMVILSTSFDGFNEHAKFTQNNKKSLLEQVEALPGLNVTDGWIACNTLNYLIDELNQKTKEIIWHNLVHLVKNKIPKNSRALFFASEPTMEKKMWQDSHYTTLHLTSEHQEKITDMILHGMKTDKIKDAIISDLKDMLSYYSPDVVVLGCTELSFLAEWLKKHSAIETIDSLETLAENIVDIHEKDTK